MIHDGEGEAGAGEVNRRPGRFTSLCCAAEVAVAGGGRFPPCPRCGRPADWTWRAPLAAAGLP